MNTSINFLLIVCALAITYHVNSQEVFQIKIDSLLQELAITKEDSNKVNTLNALAWEYLMGAQPALAEPYISKARALSQVINYIKGEAVAANYFGIFYQINNNYLEAFNFYIQSLELSEKAGYLKGIAFSNQCIGALHSYQGNYSESTIFYKNALKIYDIIGDKKGIGFIYSNIGQNHSILGNYEEALMNFSESLKIFTELDEVGAICNQNLNIGKTYKLLHNYPKALEHYNTALTFAKKEGTDILIARSLIGISHSKMYLLKYKEAREDINKALSFSKGKEDAELSSNIYETLSILDSLSGNWKGAYHNHLKYVAYREKVKDMESVVKIAKSQANYNYEKQKAIDDLENKKRVAIEIQKKENQQKLSIAVGVGLLLTALLALVIFNRLRVTRRQKVIIEEQKKKVEQSERYKEQFLANMSHEIRTPMHAISGMVKILERNEHPPAQDAYLNAMRTNTNNLLVILNDILDLSKIEAGKLDIESIPMNPAAVIEHVVQILRYKAEEKGLALKYQIADDVPPLVMGDPTRLNQVLINLVGNAIKFTEKGDVNISLAKENEWLKFSVKDTGIGIPKDKLESIFGAFEQAKGSTSRNYGGTGLGLNISKQLVELQKGKIWVASEAGQGSTFYLELPIIAAVADAVGQDLITEEHLKSMAASLNGIRILLAEDNPFNQMIAQDDLSFYIENVKIDIVENGAQAVEQFRAGNYDLVLMDVQMPEMNGFEAARKIREIEQSEGRERTIPIIAMTASLLKKEIDNCYAAGMDNYIPKPYKAEELIGSIYQELKG